MKTNVDLTENRDFGKRATRKRRLREVLNGFSYSHGLMARHQDLIQKFYYDKGAIYQGNNHERETKKFVNSFSDGIYCDCCGRPLYPYYNNTICPQCSERSEYRENLRRIFWLERRS